MPLTSQRGNARTRLADVLADIRNSRVEQLGINQDGGPTPAKRRAAVNYVELSGNNTKHSRSSTARASITCSQNNTPDLRTLVSRRKRTYKLRLFDRIVDLAPFITDSRAGDEEISLYPVCRAWVDGDDTTKSQQGFEQLPPPQLEPSDKQKSSRSPKKQTFHKQDRVDTSNSPSNSATPEITYDNAPAADVHRLPSPSTNAEISKKFGVEIEGDDADLRIPSTIRQYKQAADLEKTFDKTFNTMAHHECVQINRDRWRNVRKEWAQTDRIYKLRYEDSFKILNDMYKAQQRES